MTPQDNKNAMDATECNEYLARKLMGYKGTRTWERWNPYNDITQALGDGGEGTVVGAMVANDWGYMLQDLNKFVPCLCIFVHKELGSVYAKANTPAAAICLAAVEALKAC